jgi:hypothetical protein
MNYTAPKLKTIAEEMGIFLTEEQEAKGYNNAIENGKNPDYCRRLGISDIGTLSDEHVKIVYRSVLREHLKDAPQSRM